jgi:hypothetical protein
MRTKTLLFAVAAMAAGLAASTAQVYSLNVVGYVNKTIIGNDKYTAIANPLNTTNNTLLGVLSALPNNHRVLKWPPGNADFDSYIRNSVSPGGFIPPGSGTTVTFAPGEGALIYAPAGSSDLTNTFVGEVMQGNLTNSMLANYQLVGNMVPDSGLVTALGLVPPSSPSSSRLLKWNNSLTPPDWDTFIKTAGPWVPTTPSIDVGEGFMINASAAFDWVRNFTVAP